ncbi:hypothetical protein S40293_10229, partial [Stachybotrys chartarum IBT 40293]
MRNKPDGEGLKVWQLSQLGYLLRWIYQEDGPLGIEYRHSKTPIKDPTDICHLNKTQAVVATLVDRLKAPGPVHVFVDNLFTGADLINVIRLMDHGLTGTVRPNAGIHEDIIKLKALDNKGQLDWEWGHHQSWPTANCLVNFIAWKDHKLVLFGTSIYTGEELETRRRRRPTSNSPWIKAVKRKFGDRHIMDLELLAVAADYNDLMNAVDISDQYRAQTVSDHRERRGAAKALAWSFHLSVAVANSFLLQKLGHPQWPKVPTRYKWLDIIINEIFERYGKTGISRQRYRAGDQRTPFELHKMVYAKQAPCQAGESIYIYLPRPQV